MIRCVCCGSATVRMDRAERLCSLCFHSWEKSAAYTVWKMNNGKVGEAGYTAALAQFVAGRSCACEIGRQKPEGRPW